MRFVCDAAGRKAWFRIETEAEAARESELMRHAVEKHFRRAHEQASQGYRPAPGPYVEQDIGRAAHIRRAMPVFLTLRDAEGTALATAMLAAAGGAGRPGLQSDGRRPRQRRPLPGARGSHPGARPAFRPHPRPRPLLPVPPNLSASRAATRRLWAGARRCGSATPPPSRQSASSGWMPARPPPRWSQCRGGHGPRASLPTAAPKRPGRPSSRRAATSATRNRCAMHPSGKGAGTTRGRGRGGTG